jgi:anaerobic ribonucleoside-triphosphate reductase
MSMYFEGYNDALKSALRMNEQELYELIDSLFGRENLTESPDIHELRSEAIRQIREDFTNKNSREYADVKFYTKLHSAMKGTK